MEQSPPLIADKPAMYPCSETDKSNPRRQSRFHYTYLIISHHVRLDLRCDPYLPFFPIKTLYEFRASAHATSPAHLFFLYLFYDFIFSTVLLRGTAVAQWLRCCATNRKVASSIPDGVIGIFH